MLRIETAAHSLKLRIASIRAEYALGALAGTLERGGEGGHVAPAGESGKRQDQCRLTAINDMEMASVRLDTNIGGSRDIDHDATDRALEAIAGELDLSRPKWMMPCRPSSLNLENETRQLPGGHPGRPEGGKPHRPLSLPREPGDNDEWWQGESIAEN